MANNLGNGVSAHLSEGRENIATGDSAAQRSCLERSELEARFDATIEAYGESVRTLINLHTTESQNVFQRVLEARSACETLRTALADHETRHRCATGVAASA